MTTISVCSFMMNEFLHVRNMLDSIKQIEPDEIVIVDEYSNDGTRDILKEYNVKIVDGKLENNYSNIRNLALSNVSPRIDWILFIDADELLSNDLVNMLKNGELIKLCNEKGYDCVAFSRKNYIDNNLHEIFWPDYQSRMFRNNKNIHYIGNVHEQLVGFTNRLLTPQYIIHNKSSLRQLKQNIKYNIMYKNTGMKDLINPKYEPFENMTNEQLIAIGNEKITQIVLS